MLDWASPKELARPLEQNIHDTSVIKRMQPRPSTVSAKRWNTSRTHNILSIRHNQLFYRSVIPIITSKDRDDSAVPSRLSNGRDLLGTRHSCSKLALQIGLGAWGICQWWWSYSPSPIHSSLCCNRDKKIVRKQRKILSIYWISPLSSLPRSTRVRRRMI